MSNEITWRLENENIGRLLVHYAIPAVIGTMVNALYNIVDRIFIGQGVGALAISGLTLTFPILRLYAGIWNVDRCGSRYKGLHSSRP